MKKALKSSLSILLAVAIIFSSAYAGLRELDFNGLFYVNPFKNLIVKSQAADYSSLSPNQYMSKVILNYNYIGVLNEYGALNRTPQQELVEDIYYIPANASSARIIYDEFKNANDFQTTKGIYELLTFDLSDATSQIMELEDYYTTIILSVIDAKFSDDNFIDSVNCETNKNIVTLTNGVADILETNTSYDFSNLSDIPMTMLTDEEAGYILDEIIDSANHKNLYNLVGKDVSLISDIMFAADTVSDAIKNICAYTSIADTSVAIENVLYEIYINCPSSNAPLKTASSQVYQYVSEQMSYETLSMISAGEAAMEVGTKILLSSVWDACLTGVLGHFAVGVMVGQAVGKAISNFCFGTDAKLEQLVVIGCLVDFEDVMVSSVKSLAADYKNNQSKKNADNYIKALELLLSTYNLGHIYGSDFMTLVYTEGVISSIKYSGSDNLQTWLDISNSRQANMPWWIIRFPHYAPFYKEDASSGYELYFGDGEYDESTDTVKAEYLTLNKTSVELALNTTTTLVATVYPSNVPHADLISFTSSDELVVKVDVVEGVITPVGPGTATITVIGPNVVTSTCTVTVLPFKLLKNDTGFAISEYVGKSSTVNIPDYISNFYINGIEDSVFSNHSEIKNVTIPDSVTSIGSNAFYNCSNLTSVIIGESVKNIGNAVFYNCKNLKKVYWNAKNVTDFTSSSNVFYDAGISSSGIELVFGDAVEKIPAYLCRTGYRYEPKITSVIIGDNVTSIGEYAFDDCDDLTSITIPNNIKSIGSNAFYGCTLLNEVHINDLDAWFSIEFNDNPLEYAGNLYLNGNLVTHVDVPSDIDEIPQNIFNGCTCLQTVTISNNIKSIGDYAFSGCTSLNNISISDGIEYIGDGAFYECKSLLEINIPDSIISIGDAVFAFCYNLNNVFLGPNVQEIGLGTFARCTSLESINVSPENQYFSSKDGVLFNKVQTKLICYPSGKNEMNYIIPNSVKEVDYGAFMENNHIESVTVPDNVLIMGYGSFADCHNLKTIDIGNGLSEIPGAAFVCCFNLSEINLGNGIRKINEDAFGMCTSLVTIDIPDTVTSIGAYAFDGCTLLNEVHINDLDAWFSIEFKDNPLEYAGNLYLNGNLVTHVDVPSDIDEIPQNIFNGCTCLQTVTISNNIKSIGYSAFNGCDALSDVYYLGLISNWDNIDIDFGNACLTDATIHHLCTYDDWVTVLEPTCIECGSRSKTCLVCDEVVTEKIEVIGHNYSEEWTIDVEATCIKDGSKSHHCTVCGDKTDITVITASGHNYVITDVESTHPHTTSYKCSLCDSTKTENVTVSDCIKCIYGEDTPIKETEYTEIDFNNMMIFTSVKYSGDVTEILGLSESATVVVTASHVYGEYELYGTGTIVSVFDSDNHIGDFTLIVEGDTNGDSICDALDCFDVERVANGNADLSGAYAMAADSNSDDIVDITDYQAVVNKALAS